MYYRVFMDNFSSPDNKEVAQHPLECSRSPTLAISRVELSQEEGMDMDDQDDQITVTIGSIPFFVDSDDNHSNVAAEIEVETTANGCENSITLTVHAMNSCQLSPMLDDHDAPKPCSPSPDLVDEDLEIISEIPLHQTSSQGARSEVSAEEDNEVSSPNVSSHNSPTKSVVDMVTGLVDKVCEKEAEVKIASHSSLGEKINEDKVMAVRVSCIKWAQRNQQKSPDSQQEIQNGDSDDYLIPIPIFVEEYNGNETTTSLPDSLMELGNCCHDANEAAASEENCVENMGQRQTSVSEITTTGDDEIIYLEEALRNQSALKSDSTCCCHPCCLIIREILACLPFWMSHQQLEECMKAHIAAGRHGFEDPPESEWPTVNVYHIDPTDGTLRYKCRNCEGVVEQKSIRQRNYLNYGRLKHECAQCKRKYTTRKSLRHHLLRHSEKTRICQFCEKKFLTQGELQNHLNTHTKETPYVCPVCNQKFSHSSRYYSHVRTFHKKYDCNGCYSKVCSAVASSTSYSTKSSSSV